MNDEVTQRVLAIKKAYRDKNVTDGHKKWDVSDYMSGLVGDIGDLSKLIMAKQRLRGFDDDIDAALQHEIGDCFWSLIVLCDELGMTVEDAMEKTLKDLEERLAV